MADRKRPRIPVPATIERALDAALDRAIDIERPMVQAYIDRTRRKYPWMTPTQVVKRWDLPYGWTTPQDVGSGVHLYKLEVPTEAAVGETEIQAYVGEGEPLRIPITIRVAPAVIRS